MWDIFSASLSFLCPISSIFLLPLFLLLNFFFFSFPSSSTVQLYTYQRPFMLRFAQVSARLDIELLITQKKRREVSCIYIVCKHVQYQHVVWCFVKIRNLFVTGFFKSWRCSCKISTRTITENPWGIEGCHFLFPVIVLIFFAIKATVHLTFVVVSHCH